MPIIKSAKKRMKQAEKRRLRNYPVRSTMKSSIKKILILAKEGKKDEAEKMLPAAYKIIDTATKKNILHKNTAARKKSLIARTVAKSRSTAGPAVKAEKVAAKTEEVTPKATQEEKTEEKEA